MFFHRQNSPVAVVVMDKVNCKECNEEIWVFREKEVVCQGCIRRLANETDVLQS